MVVGEMDSVEVAAILLPVESDYAEQVFVQNALVQHDVAKLAYSTISVAHATFYDTGIGVFIARGIGVTRTRTVRANAVDAGLRAVAEQVIVALAAVSTYSGWLRTACAEHD